MNDISILVVEDSPNWQMLYKRVLTGSGYPCEIVDSSDKAKEKLREKTFHIAILDIRLIDWDQTDDGGMEILEWLGESDSSTKVIICTGYATPERIRKAFRSGMVIDFLSKETFSPSEIITLINKTVGE